LRVEDATGLLADSLRARLVMRVCFEPESIGNNSLQKQKSERPEGKMDAGRNDFSRRMFVLREKRSASSAATHTGFFCLFNYESALRVAA
jgi:hypothetical protein